MLPVEMKKYGFRIRTRGGSVVDNLTIQGRDRDEAERKLRQVYHHCTVLEARELGDKLRRQLVRPETERLAELDKGGAS